MTDGDVRTVLSGYIAEAVELRFAGEIPPAAATAERIMESLLDARRRLDRVEELLGRAIRVRAAAHRASAHATATVEDAWDQAVSRARNGPVVRGDEYSSAKERHAEANLTVLDLRRAARVAAELSHVCDEAVDVLRLSHRGLDGYRQDHLTLLRTLQFETTLDR